MHRIRVALECGGAGGVRALKRSNAIDERVKRPVLQLYLEAIPPVHPRRSNTLALIARAFLNSVIVVLTAAISVSVRNLADKGPHRPLLQIPDGPWRRVLSLSGRGTDGQTERAEQRLLGKSEFVHKP